MFRRKVKKCSYDRENLKPVIRSSICTGEQVAGFKNIRTGKFSEVMLIRSGSDLREFLETYDISEADVTVVWLSPVLPFINDTEENISGILDMCAEAKVYGVICFGMGLTLREGNREYFYEQLDRLFPGLKEQYIRTYGDQYMIESGNSQKLMRLFHRKCEKYGIVHDNDQIFRYLSAFEEKDDGGQLSIWD